MELALIDHEIQVSCPLVHQEVVAKNQWLQKEVWKIEKERKKEKLNSQFIEAVAIHEGSELAELTRENILIDRMKILKERKELLNDFDENPARYNEHVRLQVLYLKILNK